MASSCSSCGSDRIVVVSERDTLCLRCGSGGKVLTWPEVESVLAAQLTLPVEDVDADAVVMTLLKRVWNAAKAAGVVEGARAALEAMPTKEGRLKRLRAIYPPSNKTEKEEFELLLNMGVNDGT